MGTVIKKDNLNLVGINKKSSSLSDSNDSIIQVDRLKTYFKTDDGIARAVDDVSFNLEKGETLGIVGESGCGKSVTSLSIMRLIPEPPGYFEGGKIIYNDKDLLTLPEKEMRAIRGNKISMIFQEPMTSLNPVFTIGNQIVEAVELHQQLNKHDAKDKAIEMLKLVGIPSPQQRFDEYPHQLSGGMRQRVMIAMALSCEPDILIADEPTTALDVTIQAQILDLIKKLQVEMNLSVILITHDLGVVSEVCDKVLVMYAGEVIEYGATDKIFNNPQHPYTLGLIKSIPTIGEDKSRKLYNIRGMVPSATNFPSGCHFHPRCEIATDQCSLEKPILEPHKDNKDYLVRCFEVNK